MKVLISAYACEPERGSEPGVGWNFVKEMSKLHELWVITRSINSRKIATFLHGHELPNVHWIYFDLPSWIPFFRRPDRLEFIYYFFWQLAIYPTAIKLHQKIEFNLVHHITFVTYWMPTLLFMIPVPFIWGPVGGGEMIPQSLMSSLPLYGRISEYFRLLIHRFFELNPLLRLTAKKSDIILATSPETKRRIEILSKKKCIVWSQVGIPDREFEWLSKTPFKDVGPFTIFSAGELKHFKAYHLALKAFSIFLKNKPEAQYWIFGEGPAKESLQAMCRTLNIEHHVKFVGLVVREDFLKSLVDCDIFLHPSMHESGGWVIAEAHSAGRPVICINSGGPGLQVSDTNGRKIFPLSSSYVIEQIADAMKSMSTNHEQRKRMYYQSIKEIKQNYLWSIKIHQFDRLYNEMKIQ